ncbi:palmitoyltransferase [Saccharomycopsis crataegensis]|uniref:Palmitoyltransferase n=1 Tax=Saccharomycopsis crataegensis TaxID=43959 RepID=A0AAV5QFR8_9ASCO|nr:palmitoyltransferase [Saccharomycopsis crataegensis]
MRACHQIERFCCAFTVLFPKLFCNGFYIWAGYTYCWQISLNYIGGFFGFLLCLIGLFLTLGGILSYYRIVSLGAGVAVDYPELRIKYVSDDHEDDLAIGDLNDESLIQFIKSGIINPPPQYYSTHTFTIKSSGIIRYCNKCKVWKPDRCHHCSTCKQCVLKMDHHCPWFATCIGYKNHKFFIQFLTYTTLLSALCGLTSLQILYDFIFKGIYLHYHFSINWIFLFIFGVSFFFAVAMFDGFSIYQIVTNRTTLESYDYTRYRIDLNAAFDSYYQYSNKPNSDQYGNLFSLGTKSENWKAVMGNSWLEWCLPIVNNPTTKDYYFKNGLCYPVNENIYNELVYNARLQLQLATELNNYRMRRMKDSARDPGTRDGV